MNRILALAIISILSCASSCESSDPDDGRDPSDPRCGYLLPNRSLYDICTENPFPTELHPATSIGANTISCYINDTIVFRNWRPALMGRPDAEARRYDEDSTTWQIFGTYENFQEIDKRRMTLYLMHQQPDTFWTTQTRHLVISGFGDLTGTYNLDTSKVNLIESTLRDNITFGSFDIWLIDKNDSSKHIHLTDGQFDVQWYWF